MRMVNLQMAGTAASVAQAHFHRELMPEEPDPGAKGEARVRCGKLPRLAS
jgi:hypothetical protein